MLHCLLFLFQTSLYCFLRLNVLLYSIPIWMHAYFSLFRTWRSITFEFISHWSGESIIAFVIREKQIDMVLLKLIVWIDHLFDSLFGIPADFLFSFWAMTAIVGLSISDLFFGWSSFWGIWFRNIHLNVHTSMFKQMKNIILNIGAYYSRSLSSRQQVCNKLRV